jgi:hypothetical protein
VPLLLLPFKSVAVAAIERETQRWAAAVRADQQLPPANGRAQPT